MNPIKITFTHTKTTTSHQSVQVWKVKRTHTLLTQVQSLKKVNHYQSLSLSFFWSTVPNVDGEPPCHLPDHGHSSVYCWPGSQPPSDLCSGTSWPRTLKRKRQINNSSVIAWSEYHYVTNKIWNLLTGQDISVKRKVISEVGLQLTYPWSFLPTASEKPSSPSVQFGWAVIAHYWASVSLWLVWRSPCRSLPLLSASIQPKG